ncbi:MAG: ABC transporter permease subunit [Propionicimonas sp.]|uniref:ABC transporter permease n=1 Tax=Propionicimonas sp. TaxID=1955623 RepID=UPI002B1F765F|nr:ABC transporter permease subunit [Propionicimonas sp.]MEA4945404.1 ABC transporter permease subunit [Propionicimonas sp.]MEA5052521.1 ABC transporter permease subunit [Propionicimonas sp.]
MNPFADALAWLSDPARAHGPDGIWTRLGEHLAYSVVAVTIAAVLAVPLGWLVGHFRRGRGFVVATSGAARALPTLGVLTLAALALGIGLVAPLVALVILAFPSVLAGAYAGVEAINPKVTDAARGMGFSGWQVLGLVEIPLGLPLLIGGLRSAVLQVVATATLAAYTGAGGLGRFLFLGLKTQDYTQMLAAALLVVALAVVLDLVFEVAEQLARRAVGAVGAAA